jgi:hypothetical protein
MRGAHSPSSTTRRGLVGARGAGLALHFGLERSGGVLRAHAGLTQVLDSYRQPLEGDARSQQRVARRQQVGDGGADVGRQESVHILGPERLGGHRSHRSCNDRARRVERFSASGIAPTPP